MSNKIRIIVTTQAGIVTRSVEYSGTDGEKVADLALQAARDELVYLSFTVDGTAPGFKTIAHFPSELLKTCIISVEIVEDVE